MKKCKECEAKAAKGDVFCLECRKKWDRQSEAINKAFERVTAKILRRVLR